jgi:hypothetical protein
MSKNLSNKVGEIGQDTGKRQFFDFAVHGKDRRRRQSGKAYRRKQPPAHDPGIVVSVQTGDCQTGEQLTVDEQKKQSDGKEYDHTDDPVHEDRENPFGAASVRQMSGKGSHFYDITSDGPAGDDQREKVALHGE